MLIFFKKYNFFQTYYIFYNYFILKGTGEVGQTEINEY